MPSGLFYLNSLDRSISDKFLLLLWFTEIPVFNSNSVDPDQTPRALMSDLGLHCLPMSLLWKARHKWVKKHHCTSIPFSIANYPRLSPAN